MRRQQIQPTFRIEVRPEMRGTPEFRLLVDAPLSAAREELEWTEARSLRSHLTETRS